MMSDMGGRHAAWLLLVLPAAVGWVTAHCLAYVLVASDPHDGAGLHSEAGHGYLGAVAPVVAACAGSLLLVGLALAIADGMRGRARSRLPGWPVALVPPLGFAVQEHAERWIASDAFSVATALEPTFLVGIALQLPFALGALVVARAVLALGHRLGRAIEAPRSPRLRARAIAWIPLGRLEPELARPPILATGHSERGPPLATVA